MSVVTRTECCCRSKTCGGIDAMNIIRSNSSHVLVEGGNSGTMQQDPCGLLVQSQRETNVQKYDCPRSRGPTDASYVASVSWRRYGGAPGAETAKRLNLRLLHTAGVATADSTTSCCTEDSLVSESGNGSTFAAASRRKFLLGVTRGVLALNVR